MIDDLRSTKVGARLGDFWGDLVFVFPDWIFEGGKAIMMLTFLKYD
jgi:hypothetical protein